MASADIRETTWVARFARPRTRGAGEAPHFAGDTRLLPLLLLHRPGAAICAVRCALAWLVLAHRAADTRCLPLLWLGLQTRHTWCHGGRRELFTVHPAHRLDRPCPTRNPSTVSFRCLLGTAQRRTPCSSLPLAWWSSGRRRTRTRPSSLPRTSRRTFTRTRPGCRRRLDTPCSCWRIWKARRLSVPGTAWRTSCCNRVQCASLRFRGTDPVPCLVPGGRE